MTASLMPRPAEATGTTRQIEYLASPPPGDRRNRTGGRTILHKHTAVARYVDLCYARWASVRVESFTMLFRRDFCMSLGAALSLAGPASAGWPLFFRALIGASARRTAQNVGRHVVSRATVSSGRIRPGTTARVKDVRGKMARNENRFDRPEFLAAGRLAKPLIEHLGQRGVYADEFAMATNSSPLRNGSLCTAFITNDERSAPAFLENPELVSLAYASDDILNRQQIWDPFEVFSAMVPIQTIDPGNFDYERGHLRPRVFKTTNGYITFDSKVLGPDLAKGWVAYKPDYGPVEAFEVEHNFEA